MDMPLPQYDHLLSGGKAYPYQVVGTAVALVERRCFIGDEMGLGKSLEALMAVEHDHAFPCVITCPANLKDQWAAEIKRWFPHRQVELIRTSTVKPARLPDWVPLSQAEFIIIGYPGLHGWASTLASMVPEAVIFDESHYLANSDSQRTKAAKLLADSVPADGLRLALTGTFLLNRTEELIPQLEILDRLHDIAPTPRFGVKDERAWRASFREAFCGFGADLETLHNKLRACCYIRRERVDVGHQISPQGFRQTVRRPVRLTLNGALDMYREAETDLVRYLYETQGAAAARGAVRSQALTKLTTLRRLAGEAKVLATIEWIDNFLVSNPTKSLIVFAHHQKVQHALLDHYGCLSILGGQSGPDIENDKRAFQAGDERLIVCSLSAAREGHTLTRASDVLFVELGWTPGGMDQASDRSNRIGQTAETVFAWYLIGEDTLDLRVMEILEAKRGLSNAVVVGRSGLEVAVDSLTVDSAVLDSYLTKVPA